MLYLRFWRPSLNGQVAAKYLVASVGVLALLVGLLTTTTLLFRPTTAHADANARLDTFFIVSTSSMPYGVYHPVV